jgi:hypothetical protein
VEHVLENTFFTSIPLKFSAFFVGPQIFFLIFLIFYVVEFQDIVQIFQISPLQPAQADLFISLFLSNHFSGAKRIGLALADFLFLYEMYLLSHACSTDLNTCNNQAFLTGISGVLSTIR